MLGPLFPGPADSAAHALIAWLANVFFFIALGASIRLRKRPGPPGTGIREIVAAVAALAAVMSALACFGVCAMSMTSSFDYQPAPVAVEAGAGAYLWFLALAWLAAVALSRAVSSWKVAAPVFLVAIGASLALDRAPQRLMFLCARNGDAAGIRLLADMGVAVNIRDNAETTPLMRAGVAGRLDAAKELLRLAADVDASRHDWTALDYAAQAGRTDIVRLLTAHGARLKGRDLLEAAQEGHTDIVRILVEIGVGVDSCNYEKWTSLMFAAKDGHEDIARLLLDKGATVDARADDGTTALSAAAVENHGDIARLLIERGADVRLYDAAQDDPLTSAAVNSNASLLRLLLDHGAKPDGDGTNAMTPLMYAATAECAECVSSLLVKGANPFAKNGAGQTALDLARKPDIIAMLKSATLRQGRR